MGYGTMLINPPTNCLSVLDHFVGLTIKGLMMLEFWKDNTDKKNIWALLTDLFKAFKYWSIEVDSFFSSWEDILSGLPQGSILRFLLFSTIM